MKFRIIMLGCALLIALTGKFFNAEATSYIKIDKPFANVYEYLDPTSKILQQAQKGDYFELVYEGTSWYQVKIQDKVGWVEKRAGTLVKSKGATIFSIPIVTFFVFLAVFIATIVGTFAYINRQKSSEV